MNDDAFREVAADVMAQRLCVELLLCQYLKAMPPEIRGEVAQLLKNSGRNTEAFSQLRASDEQSELLADVTVRMFASLDRLVDRGLERAAGSQQKKADRDPAS